MNSQPRSRSFTKTILLLGVLLTVGAVAAWATDVMVNSRANTVSQRLMTTNESPVVNTLTVGVSPGGPMVTDVTPTENGSTVLYVSGVISDPNGCDDLQDVALVLHRSDLDANCSADLNNCYKTTVNSFSGCINASDTDAHFQTEVLLAYYADPTDAGSPYEASNWVVSATITDRGGLTANADSQGFELDSIAALATTPNLDFGVISLGQVSQPKAVYLTNTGNRDIKPYFVAVADMACDGSGSQRVPAAQLHMASMAMADAAVALDGSTDSAEEFLSTNLLSRPSRESLWNQGTPLSLSLAQTRGGHIAKNLGVPSNPFLLYFALKLPTSGIAGVCTMTLKATAVAQ